MWDRLWQDFATRAHRLRERPEPLDAVDRTILWQLEGHQTYVGAPIAHQDLQLPEIYSGSPWHASERWIALLTINPSMDPAEVYPTLAMYEQLGASPELISFFERRFHAECARPLRHGRPARDRSRPRSWRRVAGQLSEQLSSNNTWSRIDGWLRKGADLAGVDSEHAPLGHLGAIVDVVPWKFKNWRRGRCRLRELDRYGQAAPRVLVARASTFSDRDRRGAGVARAVRDPSRGRQNRHR